MVQTWETLLSPPSLPPRRPFFKGHPTFLPPTPPQTTAKPCLPALRN
jgi:hypothetical protein